MEPKPTNPEVHFQSGVEHLTLTPLGDLLYRMEFGRFCFAAEILPSGLRRLPGELFVS
jgi:hypothetical protein